MDDFARFGCAGGLNPPSTAVVRGCAKRFAGTWGSWLLVAGTVLLPGSVLAEGGAGGSVWYHPSAGYNSFPVFNGTEDLFPGVPAPTPGPEYPLLLDQGSIHPHASSQNHLSGAHELDGGISRDFSPHANPASLASLESGVMPEGIDWERATRIDLDFPSGSSEREGTFGDFFYRGAGRQVPMTWLIGKGDRMGIFTLPLLSDSDSSFGWLGYDFGGVIHFFSGPRQTDLPPRLYDLTVALPRRQRLTENLWVDLMFRAGWYTDFRASARQAFRFPSHAVVYYRTSPHWQWVLGLDYLHRDDVQLLPVLGTLWTPHADWRVEAVFPKPMIAYRFAASHWLYFASEMGGGMWTIERQDGSPDKFTYRDFRLTTGIQLGTRRSQLFAEIGWALERHLQYRSGTPSYDPPDTIFLRLISRY